MGYVVLAIVVLVVLAGVVLLAAMRRNDANRAIGELSRETKKRDRDLATVTAGAPVSGREVERAAVLARRGVSTDLVPVRVTREGPQGLLRARVGGHGKGCRRAVSKVSASRLPCTQLQHLAVVRVPVPWFAVQPRR